MNGSQADSAISELVGLCRGFFGRRLISVVLYGSILFDDLAPGYGDLDFLAVVDGDLAGLEGDPRVRPGRLRPGRSRRGAPAKP